ncbi:MAG TPA: hypothetical protein VG603_04050, partial [Chitinophagales bacterium]|nr:hypothetical protein [Chitinophagales bacterium]
MMETNRLTLKYTYIIALVALLIGCKGKHKTPLNNQTIAYTTDAIGFPFFLGEKTTIINTEQDNEIEGHYLRVSGRKNDSTLEVALPKGFYINNLNCRNWMIGWGTGKPYYDAGNENLREITNIDTIKNRIVVGRLLRGEGMPAIGNRVVFWNRSPSGFITTIGKKVVKPEWWPGFAGHSMEFGAVIYDSAKQEWIMYLQEVDTVRMQIYAATSKDLNTWQPYNQGKALFTPADFKSTNWAGLANDGKTPQTARIYSAVYHMGLWYLFLSGYGKNGYRQIGLITCKDPLLGPFDIHTAAIIAEGSGNYDSKGCFYPKVCTNGKKFLLYYDGVNTAGTENVCMAESENLLNWVKNKNNPVITSHYGWRSGGFTSEPNYVKAKNDTVWLMAGGYKKYNAEFNAKDSIEGRAPINDTEFSCVDSLKGLYVSGNVMDAALGVF